ncbi:MAG: hypothetical protein ACLFU0_10255, partial [Alphaproteobacteria bacterium]
MRRLIAIRRGLTRQESEPIGTGRVDAGIGPLVAARAPAPTASPPCPPRESVVDARSSSNRVRPGR